MNFTRLLYKKLKHRKLFVLRVTFKSLKEFSYEFFLLQEKKGELRIDKSWTERDFSNDKDLIDSLKKGLPVYIMVRGYGIMTKRNRGHLGKEQLGKLFPNFKIGDYYTQFEYTQENTVTTMIRKDLIRQIVDNNIFNGICFSGLFIGIAPIIPLIKYLDNSRDSICIEDIQLELTNEEVQNIRKCTSSEDQTIFFMNKEYPDYQVLVLSSGILASLNPDGYMNQDQVFSNGYKEAASATLYKRILKAGLPLLLVILMVNFYLFDRMYQKKIVYQDIVVAGESELSRLVNLKSELNQKKNFVTDYRLNESNAYSYYHDRLGSLASGKVRFQDLYFNPNTKKLKPGSPIVFRNGIVTIIGLAYDVETYRVFMQELKEENWIKEVVIQDYVYEAGEDHAFFHLELKCDFSN